MLLAAGAADPEVVNTRTVAIGSAAFSGRDIEIPPASLVTVRGLCASSASRYAPETRRGTF
jgi:hypothetical protein